MKKRWWLTGGAGLLVLLLLSRNFSTIRASGAHPSPALTEVPRVQVEAGEAQRESEPQLAPHPSLAGTDVNGNIRLNAAGRVVYHRDLRRLFDYYLSLRGRMSPAQIRSLLEDHLQHSPMRGGTTEALALFDQYVSLIDAESKMDREGSERDLSVTSQVAQLLDERRNRRREYLGDALSEAFYADQETYESYQLERMQISQDSSLSEEEKAAALTAAENLLTPEQREIRRQTFAWLDIKKAARQPIESLDADTAEAIRQRFGENALDRLAAVQKEKDEWELKRKAWLDEKARIESRKDLSTSEKKASLQDYADAHLDRGEQRRMEALDGAEETTL